MYDFTCLSHIVGGFILRVGMRVWVVCTHTRTRLPDGYMMMLIYVPAGRNIIPYPSTYRVKLVGYSGFRYPLPYLVGVLAKLSGTSATNLQLNYSPAGAVQGWQQGGAGPGDCTLSPALARNQIPALASKRLSGAFLAPSPLPSEPRTPSGSPWG
jgi:hypothetical protein